MIFPRSNWSNFVHKVTLITAHPSDVGLSRRSAAFRPAAPLKPATHVTETGTSRLVTETCTCVDQSGNSIFLVPVSVME